MSYLQYPNFKEYPNLTMSYIPHLLTIMEHTILVQVKPLFTFTFWIIYISTSLSLLECLYPHFDPKTEVPMHSPPEVHTEQCLAKTGRRGGEEQTPSQEVNNILPDNHLSYTQREDPEHSSGPQCSLPPAHLQGYSATMGGASF